MSEHSEILREKLLQEKREELSTHAAHVLTRLALELNIDRQFKGINSICLHLLQLDHSLTKQIVTFDEKGKFGQYLSSLRLGSPSVLQLPQMQVHSLLNFNMLFENALLGLRGKEPGV